MQVKKVLSVKKKIIIHSTSVGPLLVLCDGIGVINRMG